MITTTKIKLFMIKHFTNKKQEKGSQVQLTIIVGRTLRMENIKWVKVSLSTRDLQRLTGSKLIKIEL
jgi:hypothetical protein